MQGSNPIYNLLPDILSNLSAQADLAPADFQVREAPRLSSGKCMCRILLLLGTLACQKLSCHQGRCGL